MKLEVGVVVSLISELQILHSADRFLPTATDNIILECLCCLVSGKQAQHAQRTQKTCFEKMACKVMYCRILHISIENQYLQSQYRIKSKKQQQQYITSQTHQH